MIHSGGASGPYGLWDAVHPVFGREGATRPQRDLFQTSPAGQPGAVAAAIPKSTGRFTRTHEPARVSARDVLPKSFLAALPPLWQHQLLCRVLHKGLPDAVVRHPASGVG